MIVAVNKRGNSNGNVNIVDVQYLFDPFTPKSDQRQIPHASPHHKSIITQFEELGFS